MERSGIKSDFLVTVVIPVCNEGDVIEGVLQDWIQAIALSNVLVQILIEDANSTDGTRKILSKFEGEFDFIRVSYRPDRDGFKNALIRMFQQVRSPWIFVADSDGQYLASDFQYFLDSINQSGSNDVPWFIKGVKINRRDNFFRRISSFIMNRFIVILIGLPFLDYNSSHYLIRKELLDTMLEEGFKFKQSINVEVTMRAILSNKKYQILYVKHLPRVQGMSRGNPPLKFIRYGITTILDIWNLKSHF
jgi:glycosyltransferase involved in cell wall biosynthesis